MRIPPSGSKGRPTVGCLGTSTPEVEALLSKRTLNFVAGTGKFYNSIRYQIQCISSGTLRCGMWNIFVQYCTLYTCITHVPTKPVNLFLSDCAVFCAPPAWSEFCSVRLQIDFVLDSFLSRCKRFGFTDNNLPLVELLFSDADDTFFHRVLINSHHVFQHFYHNNTKPNIMSSELDHVTDYFNYSENCWLKRSWFYCPYVL